MLREPRAVLFDLDDTLYPQRRFVFSGFAAVARHVEQAFGLDRRGVFALLLDAWKGPHRGRELQACIAHFELPSAQLPELIAVMRQHQPALRLPAASKRVLNELRSSWRTGIVTNGMPDVQARKVDKLGLRPLVDTVVFACEHGTGRGKPERDAFDAALDRLGVTPSQAVFVGNDEECDIAGAAAVGMRTILVGGETTIVDVPRLVAEIAA